MCALKTVLTCKLRLPTQLKFIIYGCENEYKPCVPLFLIQDHQAIWCVLYAHHSNRCSSSILYRFLLDHRPHFRDQNHDLQFFTFFLNIKSQLTWRTSNAFAQQVYLLAQRIFLWSNASILTMEQFWYIITDKPNWTNFKCLDFLFAIT